MVCINKKQYVLSSSKLKMNEMSCLEFHGSYLYYDKDLPIQYGTDAKKREYLLLGQAYCTDRFPKEPIDDIKNFDGESLASLSKNWTGRWVLIVKDKLITDSTGLMGAFYWCCDEQWIISSSLSIISLLLARPITDSVQTGGLDWHLLPGTIMPSVNQLFCTQYITFSTRLKVHFIERFTNQGALSTEEKVKGVISRLITSLKNIEKFSKRGIYIALTGGKDSRLVLAAALSAQVKFSSFTMEHKMMLRADKIIPEKIAKKYSFPWRFIRMQPQSDNLYYDYLLFNGGNSKGADIFFYSSHQHQQIPNDAIVIRSGLFEAGQSYGRRTMGNTRDRFQADFLSYYNTSMRAISQRASFDEWLRYESEHPIAFIDIRDRFYVEQRVNGWVSAIEQALTINDFNSIQIANCQEIISILLSASDKERLNNYLAYKMIENLVPSLLNFPVNKRTLMDDFHICKRAIIKRIFR